jgi:hypothetical protein
MKFNPQPKYITHQLLSQQFEKLIFEPPKFESQTASLMHNLKKNNKRRLQDLEVYMNELVKNKAVLFELM